MHNFDFLLITPTQRVRMQALLITKNFGKYFLATNLYVKKEAKCMVFFLKANEFS